VRGALNVSSRIFVVLIRDDRISALGDEGGESARMVRMRVRVHHVADRFAGKEVLHLVHHGLAARGALRSLDDDDVALELDGQGIVGAVDLVDAVGELRRRRDGLGGWRGAASGTGWRAAAAGWRGWRLQAPGKVRRVRRRAGDRCFKEDPAAAFLHDAGRDLQPAEVLVVAVGDIDMQVAEHVVVDPGLDALDQVLIVDVSVHAIRDARRGLDRRHPGDDRVAPAVQLLRADGRVVGGRALEKSPWRHPVPSCCCTTFWGVMFWLNVPATGAPPSPWFRVAPLARDATTSDRSCACSR
jgi:hypothetical protein